MAPTKFENNIKEKLNERTLAPSHDAWAKLSNRLDENNKRNNKPFWWLGIAASIAGLILVTFQFLKSDIRVDDIPKVVVTPEVIKQEDISTGSITEEKIATDNVEDIKNVSEEIKLKNNQKSNQNIKEGKEKVLIKSTLIKENTTIAKENDIPKQTNKSISLIQSVSKELTIEEQKIQDVVAQIKDLKTKNTVVTDEAIDALLAEAQKEIALEQLYNSTTGVVDANLLLQDVEAELDQSFRDKVLKALKDSYSSVKTAIAQRND